MLKYIARRLLLFVPTMFIILLVSFLISRNVPGDQVYNQMEGVFREGSQLDVSLRNQEYKRISHEMGLDLPTFYVSLNSIAYPDTLYRITFLNERKCLEKLIGTYGNWPEISVYHRHLYAVEAHLQRLTVPSDQHSDFLEAQRAVGELKSIPEPNEIEYRLNLLDSLCQKLPLLDDSMATDFKGIADRFQTIKSTATEWKLYVPTLHIYGFKNQFHHWLLGLLQGDLGKSYSANRQVKTMISEALPWTVFMGFMSFCISYMIAIPIGVYGVRKRNQWQDNTVTVILFLMHSVPSFVTAMLLMTFFCNQDYLQLFPTSGVASDGSELWDWPARLLDHAYHLILPTLVLSYSGIAFVSRQMRVGMVENLNMDFIRTAKAKGLPEKVVIWRHNLRNSLLPLITLFGGLLPQMVSGAIITETIFSVPGMGLLASDAMFSYDHPVILGVFTISAIATLLGVLMADILYAIADPRISYSRR